jgi:inosine/xanthosine triphosphate pyrophosphatase family protein
MKPLFFTFLKNFPGKFSENWQNKYQEALQNNRGAWHFCFPQN